MLFTVNYSPQAETLLREKKIELDRFKCPAWPDLIATAQKAQPVHVHFPLRVGAGLRDAISTQTGQPADWTQVESLLEQTDTTWVNLHLSPAGPDYPDIPLDTLDPAHIEFLTERMIEDVRAVVQRFGPERVIVENLPDDMKRLRPAFLPQVINRVVEETGCGFLFDLAHARLAAHSLGMDVYDYVSELPTARTREIHVTGVQCFDGEWLELAQQTGVDAETIHERAGRLFDHLPMTGPDWDLFAWAMEQAHAGRWNWLEMVTFEYGGVGWLFGAFTKTEVLAEQVPRLYKLTKSLPNQATL